MMLYIWYASLWKAWMDALNAPVRKPPGLEEGVRLEHERVRASEYFPHLSRGPDYPADHQNPAGDPIGGEPPPKQREDDAI